MLGEAPRQTDGASERVWAAARPERIGQTGMLAKMSRMPRQVVCGKPADRDEQRNESRGSDDERQPSTDWLDGDA